MLYYIAYVARVWHFGSRSREDVYPTINKWHRNFILRPVVSCIICYMIDMIVACATCLTELKLLNDQSKSTIDGASLCQTRCHENNVKNIDCHGRSNGVYRARSMGTHGTDTEYGDPYDASELSIHFTDTVSHVMTHELKSKSKTSLGVPLTMSLPCYPIERTRFPCDSKNYSCETSSVSITKIHFSLRRNE